MIRVELTDFATSQDELLGIRFKVFVEEQRVDPEIEADSLDSECVHAIVFDKDRPIATGRLLTNGHIGRMAVLKEYRNQGIGTAILRRLVDRAKESGFRKVDLSSQTHAVPFYQRLGFKVTSGTYLEAGIEHVDMSLEFDSDHLLNRPND